MTKKYVTTAWLKAEDSKLYGIFVWSQKPAKIIPAKSWLILLEIFVHQPSVEKAYEIFQKIRSALIDEKVIIEVEKYHHLMEDAIVLLSEESVTIFGQGFRSFIEKNQQIELGNLSQETYQVVLKLFEKCELEHDLESINNLQDFSKLVADLENFGLLAPAKGSIDWGDLKQTFPICQAFGLTRGTPVDRYYLKKFIESIRPQVVRNILEIGGTPKDKDFYQLNPDTSYQILNLEPGPGVDIVGDVHNPSIIEPNSFDSIIIFNVLEHCYAPWIVV